MKLFRKIFQLLNKPQGSKTAPFVLNKPVGFGALKVPCAIAMGLALAVFLTDFTAFAQGCTDLQQDVLRLHILANSNSAQDQALKLKVRDRLLEEGADLFSIEEGKEKAKEQAAAQLEHLTAIAQDEVYRQGYHYQVQAQIVKMYFNTREYDGFTMPAGTYDALRFTIGSGEGKNWWCVMFPPLCIPAAAGEEADLSFFTQRELQVLEQKPAYQPKFAVVELVEQVKSALENK